MPSSPPTSMGRATTSIGPQGMSFTWETRTFVTRYPQSVRACRAGDRAHHRGKGRIYRAEIVDGTAAALGYASHEPVLRAPSIGIVKTRNPAVDRRNDHSRYRKKQSARHPHHGCGCAGASLRRSIQRAAALRVVEPPRYSRYTAALSPLAARADLADVVDGHHDYGPGSRVFDLVPPGRRQDAALHLDRHHLLGFAYRLHHRRHQRVHLRNPLSAMCRFRSACISTG